MFCMILICAEYGEIGSGFYSMGQVAFGVLSLD